MDEMGTEPNYFGINAGISGVSIAIHFLQP
jgi:hypothetical protein